MDDSIDVQWKRLRREFDESFIRRPLDVGDKGENFVIVRCAAATHAIALSEISLLQGNVRIVRLPNPSPELVGVCCVRGELLAVFSLAACLGQAHVGNTHSWILRAIGTSAAFAFEHCEGMVNGRIQPTTEKTKVVVSEGRLLPLLPLLDLVAKVREESLGATRRKKALDAR